MAAAAAAAAAASTKPKLLSSKPLVFNLLHTLSFLAIACNAAGVAAKAIVQPSEKLYRRELQAATNVPVFCVAKSNADSSQLQNALDWTCGSGSSLGSVDCSAIQQGGSCYQPDTVASHASYAFTLYYYKQNGASGSCNFNGLATLTQTSPSSGTCVYPSSATSSSTTPSSPSSLNSTGLSPPFSTTFPFLDSPAPTPSGSSYTTVTASSFHGVSTFLCIVAVMSLLNVKA